MRYLQLFFMLFVATQLTAQSTIESIPNQKLINGSYVSDPDKTLDEGTIRKIDTLLKSLEMKTSVQVAVVVAESIGDEDIFEFAQKLFNTWGIGNTENDNGLLVMLVKDKHIIRFHTGDGIEGTLPDVVCKRIQRDYMVPEFKNGDYNKGILAGMQEIEKILTNPAYAEELRKPEADEVSDWVGFINFLAIIFGLVLLIFIIKSVKGRFSDSKKPEDTLYPEMRVKRLTWLLIFFAIPLLMIVWYGISPLDDRAILCFLSLYGYVMLTLFHRLWRIKKVINRFLGVQDYYGIVEFLRKQQLYWFFMGVFFPVPFGLYFFYHLNRKKIYRNHPRNCKQCQGAMNKLNERADDEYLSEGQRMEEKLRSVDYDVWKCETCSSIEVWFYLNRLSKYKPCLKCKTIAYHPVSNRTIVSPTYSSSGTGEEVHACAFCGYQNVSTYTIPQLQRSTTGSSSPGGSVSSGGSWGGGRSSGGGASSSW